MKLYLHSPIRRHGDAFKHRDNCIGLRVLFPALPCSVIPLLPCAARLTLSVYTLAVSATALSRLQFLMHFLSFSRLWEFRS
jgi:hypothetical protein